MHVIWDYAQQDKGLEGKEYNLQIVLDEFIRRFFGSRDQRCPYALEFSGIRFTNLCA